MRDVLANDSWLARREKSVFYDMIADKLAEWQTKPQHCALNEEILSVGARSWQQRLGNRMCRESVGHEAQAREC